MDDIKDEIRTACIRKGLTFATMAEAMQLDPSTVSQWFRRGRIPAERVLTVERLTGVTRSMLRPDLYPRSSGRTA